MYDEIRAATPTRYAEAAADTGVKPITLTITDQHQSSIGVASEVRSRLWTLRDRLFGAPPATPDGANPRSQPQPTCFADAAREGGYNLATILNDIDGLTLDLANRL